VDGTKRGTVTTSDDDTLAAATVEMPRTDAITRGATSSPTWWRGQGVQPPFGSLPAPAVSAVAALSVVGVIAAICAYLSQPHTTFAMAGMQVLEMHPDWTPEDAGHFAGAATGAYCPDLGPST
jgi:hypothetical protein